MYYLNTYQNLSLITSLSRILSVFPRPRCLKVKLQKCSVLEAASESPQSSCECHCNALFLAVSLGSDKQWLLLCTPKSKKVGGRIRELWADIQNPNRLNTTTFHITPWPPGICLHTPSVQ